MISKIFIVLACCAGSYIIMYYIGKYQDHQMNMARAYEDAYFRKLEEQKRKSNAQRK